MRIQVVLVALLALGSACKSSDSKSEGKGKGEPAQVPTEKASLEQPLFEVDGKTVDVGTIGEDIELLSLTALPAIDDWQTIIARSKDGREFTGSKPQLLTGVRTMKLVRLPAGYEFRVMDVKEGQPYIRHRMNTLERVIVHTKGYEAPVPAAPHLLLKSAGAESVIALDEIERTLEPGADEQRDTWTLANLLGGASPRAGVALYGAMDTELILSQEEFSDPTWLHLIKRNRRGQFHYRGWKLGETPVKEREMRGLAQIEVR